MNIMQLLEQIKKHPEFDQVGMILCHNGVVRGTSRDGRKVSGLRVAVDHVKLKQIIEMKKKLPGIIEILVHINENRNLAVGDDLMYLIVAGDIRDRVLTALSETLNLIKSTVTRKTEFFI